MFEKVIPQDRARPAGKKFTEFEIRDFIGISSSSRNPPKNSSQICKNFDFREITGDLTSRFGYRRKFTNDNAPNTTTHPIHATALNLSSVSWLRAVNFIAEIEGVEQEVTTLIGKGTLTYIGAGGAPTTINIGLFFIRPWYDGTNWVDNWHWLNECYFTDIDNLSNNTFRINGSLPNSADYFADWVIYNVTDDDYHQIYDSAYVDATETTVSLACATGSVTHNFANNDRVLVMRNFIPYADLLEYYNVGANEISFHNVLNDLRICFGGYANRLPLMIGHKNKSYAMENDAGGLLGGVGIQQISDIDKVILTPYNSITENDKAGNLLASFNTNSAFHLAVATTGASNFPPAGRYFFQLTALIDGYEEFVLPFSLFDITATTINGLGTLQSSNYYDLNGSQQLTLNPRIFWALFNKRITKIRLYVSYDSATTNQPEEPTAPYYLWKEWDLIGDASATGDYDLNNFGYLYDQTSNYLKTITLVTYTQWKKSGTTELESKLNYAITTDYVRGFDQAVVVDRVCYAINPYVGGERLQNYIAFSPFSGAGVSQYDALQGSNYTNIDTHDGNTLKGLGVFGNANLAAFKTNTVQKIRGSTAQVADLAFGHGLDTFRSIVNHGDRLTWCSQYDIMSTNSSIIQNISEGTIRNLFRAITGKTSIFATKEEKDNAYRFYDANGTQYLLSQRGWSSIETYLDPDDFIIAKDGSLWFMDGGQIYTIGTYYNDIDAINGSQAVDLQWKSIPFDISLLGESLTQSNRFWVDGIFCKYSSPANLTLKIYLDGSGTAFDTITLSSSSTYYDTAIKYGGIGHKVEIEITASVDNATTPVIISSIGLRWRPLMVGNRV